MISLFSQIQTKSQSDGETLRRKFNANFIPDLRKIEGEQEQLLVSIYDSANGGENSSDETTASSDNDDGSDSVGDL